VTEADTVRQFLQLVSPGFCIDGIAMVQADGRTLPIRFTFDEGRIARVEVL
jgi:hypothetical protein